MVERFYDMEEATGSLPVSPTRRLPHRQRIPARRGKEIVQFNQRQLTCRSRINGYYTELVFRRQRIVTALWLKCPCIPR